MHHRSRNGLWLILSILLLSLVNTPVSSFFRTDVYLPTSELQTYSIEDASTAASISSIALNSIRNLLRKTYDDPITQLEITNHLDAIMRAEGSDGALSFPSLVMTRDEFDWPYGHSNDDGEHIIDPNKEPVVTIRAGARVNGQCVDVYRTFFFESVSQEVLDAYSTILSTQLAVIDAIAPGVSVEYLDSLVQTGLSSYIGLPNITYSYYWGHGVGEFAVMEPFLSNETSPMNLTEDQLFTVQIWLYHSDGWFVRIEDTVLVTNTGVTVLSDAPKALADIYILPGSPCVDDVSLIQNYEYSQDTSINTTITDTANRTCDSVSFYNGKDWTLMQQTAPDNYSISYLLDYSFSSYILAIFKVEFSNDTTYITKELTCDPDTEFVYEETYDPPVHAVFEQVTTDDPLRWVFSKVGAEMLRLNFYNVYPPPGDQFLVKDSNGNVVYEYKWNLGEAAISPWVPGNVLYIDVISTWSSDFGGFNHFYFTVDLMWILDTEWSSSPTTETTSIPPSETSLTSIPSHTSETPGDTMPLSIQVWVLVGVVFCFGTGLIFFYLKRR